MSESGMHQEARAAEAATAPAKPAAAGQFAVEAVRCLRESRVPFALLHADGETLHLVNHIHALVEPGEIEIAAAALRRSGCREMRPDPARPGAWTFLNFEADRFVAITLHRDLLQHGLPVLDAALALSRREVRGVTPRLAKEDLFLHLLLGAALDGRKCSEGERADLVRWRRDRLDAARLAAQTERLGLRPLVEAALPELDALLREPRRWRRFRLQLWATLLRQHGMASRAWRAWRMENLHLRRHPVVLAVVGPPHAGKSELARTLQENLANTPLAAHCVSMSCWEGGVLGRRLLHALAPPVINPRRLLAARRGRQMQLSEAELQWLGPKPPQKLPLLLAVASHRLRTFTFHLLLLGSLRLRYALHVSRCRSPLVVADGWIFDLAFRHGRVPYTHGKPWRNFVSRHIPTPDGILYLSPSYELAASREPKLQRPEFEAVDHGLRRLLRTQGAVEFVTDEAPRTVALTFLRRYWAHLLERHNRHA